MIYNIKHNDYTSKKLKIIYYYIILITDIYQSTKNKYKNVSIYKYLVMN